jgi:hypothetical protein
MEQLIGLVSRVHYTAYRYTGLLDLRLSQNDKKINRTGSVRKSNIHGRSRNYLRDGKSVSIKHYECMSVFVCVCVCMCVALVIQRAKRVRRTIL